MFEDYYYNDQQLQGLLDSIGYSTPSAAPIMDTPRQAAVMPMTQEAAPAADAAPNYMTDLLSTLRAAGMSEADLVGLGNFTGFDNSLYGLNFASNFGGGPSGGIYKDDPNLQYINAPTSNKGNPTSPSGNVFTMTPDQKVRLVDLRTNTVVFEGTGYDAAREATRLGQNLTDTLGRKAEYNIQTANPAGEYTTVANEKKNKSTLGAIADVALPVIGTIVAGPLGAAAGSAVSSVAQGRSFENTLLRAGTAAAGSAVGGQLLGPASSAASSAAGSTAGSAAGGVAGTTAGSTIGSTAGDIIVNAARSVVPSVLGSAAGGAVGSAVPSLISAPPSASTQQPTPVDDTIVVSGNRFASGSGLPFGSAFPIPVDAILSGALTAAQPPIDQPKDIVVTGAEKPVIPTEALAAVPVVGGLLAATGGSAPNVVNGVDQATGDIVVSAPQSVAAPPPIAGIATAIPATIPGALTTAQTAGTPPSDKSGFLGTGLTIPQLLSLGGVGADLLQSLLAGGGGDTGAGVPYVSPFGTGAGFAPRQDMRANPNIIDYERYGFGPEAMFFQPQYTGLLPANAPAPQAPAGMSINPALMPIF